MTTRHRFCTWLVGRLMNRRMTFAEISAEWDSASANIDGTKLSLRTFQRYRTAAEELLNVNIDCHKPTNEYYVDTSPMEEADRWTMSALRLGSLLSMVDMRDVVMVEDPPAGSHLVQSLAEACKERRLISFNYKSPYKHARRYDLTAYSLRLFKQRWYIIGRQPGKEYLTTLALERISDLKVGELSGDKTIFSAKDYFADCYGIIRQLEPERVVVRAFWPQNAYLKEVPLHQSQEIVEETENWTDFSLYVRPTYDFKQELLWQRDKLTVLSPEWLRDDMMDILQRMLSSYATGLPNCKDE